MATKFEQWLMAHARQRGFREAMMGAGVQGQSGGGQSSGGGGQKAQPQGGVGSQRSANQQGGMAQPGMFSPVVAPAAQRKEDGQGGGGFMGTLLNAGVGFLTGGPIGAGAAILGSVIGGSRSSGGGQQQATGGDMYQQLQSRALSGQGILPASLTQGALSEGLGLVNAQAQRSRENLGTNLASRGILHSGIMGSGLADIEGARLGALSSLGQQIAQMNMQSQESALNREAGMVQQQRAIRANEPEWYDYLISAAPAVGQYLYNQQNPQADLGTTLAQILGQRQGGETPMQVPTFQTPPGATDLSLRRR